MTKKTVPSFHLAARLYLLTGTMFLLAFFSLVKPATLDSANLTDVADTLQSSRLSVSARVDATGTLVGGSRVKMKTVGDTAPYYTVSTANLHAGDAITIGGGNYTVVDIIDGDEFTVTPVLQAGHADDNDEIYRLSKPQHTFTLTTASALPDGYFRIMLPADATNPNDGEPDDQGFDFGGVSVTVTGVDATGYDFTTGVATASGGTGCTSPANYHCFEVHYSGNGAIGTDITITIGNTDGSNTPIAPGPSSSHTEATADTYTTLVRNYSSDNINFDETKGKIAFIEAVRVTATVDPTINFAISGVDTSTSTCGANPDIDTTTGTNSPLAVPFGALTLNTFKDASHKLTVSTNASGGYVVTASEDDELGLAGGTASIIADTTCDDSTCTQSTSAEWNTATNNGFGFSLQNIDAPSVAFSYSESARTFSAKQFANIAGGETAQTLFSSTTVANAEDVYVCYRISVGATQPAGDYENLITYTATGTF